MFENGVSRLQHVLIDVFIIFMSFSKCIKIKEQVHIFKFTSTSRVLNQKEIGNEK